MNPEAALPQPVADPSAGQAPSMPQPAPSPTAQPGAEPQDQGLSQDDIQTLLQTHDAQNGAPDEGVDPAEQAAESPPIDHGALLSDLQSAGAAPAEAPVAQGKVGETVPASSSASSLMSMLIPAPVRALLSITGSDRGAAAKLLSDVSKTPQGKKQIFDNWSGPGYESRIQDGKFQSRKAGDPNAPWTVVPNTWFEKANQFAEETIHHWPDIAEGGFQLGAEVVGGTLAGVAGLTAASIPGGIAAATAGAAAANASAAVIASGTRELMTHILGADFDPDLTNRLKWEAGTAAFLGAGSKLIFRKPVQLWASQVIDRAKKSFQGTAIRGGEIVDAFGDFYQHFAGHSIDRALENFPTLGKAGHFVQTIAESAHEELDRTLSKVTEFLNTKRPDAIYPAQTTLQKLENTLSYGDFRAVEEPSIIPKKPGEPGALKMVAGPEAKKELQPLADLWNDINSQGGFKPNDLQTYSKSLMKDVKEGSSMNKPYSQLSSLEMTYRDIRSGMAADRDIMIKAGTVGDDIAETATAANSNYSNNIDAIKELSNEVQKSPEKFARVFTTDAKAAETLKKTLGNLDPNLPNSMDPVDAVRSAWMKEILTDTMDNKTNWVDVPKFYDKLTKNGKGLDVARVFFGEDGVKQLKNIADSARAQTFDPLLEKADAMARPAMIRAITRFTGEHLGIGYAADVLTAMFGKSPKNLEQLQAQGILEFAKEATTVQARDKWLMMARAVQKIQDALTAEVTVGGKVAYSIPIESRLLGPLINAGVQSVAKPPAEKQAMKQQAYQLYMQHQHEITQQQQRQLQDQTQPMEPMMPSYANKPQVPNKEPMGLPR